MADGMITWRRKMATSLALEVPSLEKEMAPTPVFLPGEFRGQRSLAGYIVHGIAKSWTGLSDCLSIRVNKAPFPKVETNLHTSGWPEDVALLQGSFQNCKSLFITKHCVGGLSKFSSVQFSRSVMSDSL